MLVSVALFLITIPALIMARVGALINLSLPQWFIDGINNIFHGAGWLNTFLPIYTHPTYAGLAGETGIMEMFGWLLIVATYFIIVRISFWVLAWFVSVLPWSTHYVKPPHNA